jgi:hypothetical protein
MKQNLRGGYGGNPPNVRSSFMSASDIAKRIKLLEEQNKRKPQKATKEQLESGRVTENRDGTLTFNKLPGDPGYHDPSEGYTYRKNIGWTTGEEAQERFNAARDKYDAKMGMTGFRKAVQGLTDVADLAAKLPIVNSAAKQIYISDNVYIADAPNYCIRMVNATTGNITTFAGVCTVGGYSGDGGPASLANIGYPYGLAIDGKDNVYIIDSEHNVVRVAHNGTITRFIGTQSAGAYSGDGGPALLAEFSAITAIMFDEPRGVVYLMDSNNFRLRRVDLNTTIVTTVAGTGGSGNTGDNGPATSAELGRC